MYVAITSNKGRGVFADTSYLLGDIIEQCEIIKIPSFEVKTLDTTILYNYYFSRSDGNSAIVLGNGSLYNHSYAPNALYKKNFETNIIIFEARKHIHPDEEILVNYNGDPFSQAPLRFAVQENEC